MRNLLSRIPTLDRLLCRVGWRDWRVTRRVLGWLWCHGVIDYFGIKATRGGGFRVDQIVIRNGTRWQWTWFEQPRERGEGRG